jgi:sirohydrochlorin ferrochelatase
MIVALIDNGSLEPAAHRNLRTVAAAISRGAGVAVRAVSWKHSDAIPLEELDETPAWTLHGFVRALFALGQREFVFIPFFVSAQGAIGSALRADLEQLQRELGGFEFRFTDGLAARGAIPGIVAARVREAMAAANLKRPAVVVVDHGGPSLASAMLRDKLVAEIRAELEQDIRSLVAASMEGAHPPLLADVLAAMPRQGEVIVAPLFLSPGRHAGANGDIAQICQASAASCTLTELVGTHSKVADVLAAALQDTLTPLHV